jgi:hypothetical protein
MPISSMFILFFQSINFGISANMSYQLKDLEALEKDKNFEEFLLHHNDIRPSERGRHWKDMFQNMAIALIDYKIRIRDFSPEAFKQIEVIGRTSALANDEFFQLKRSVFAKKYFTECFRRISGTESTGERDLCETQLSAFWSFSKKDADLGLDLAAILEANKSSLKLWPFYELAIKDSIAGFYCKKPVIQSALMKKLYEESYKVDFNGNYKNLINKIVPESCFNEIILPLKASLTSIKTNGLEKEMALNILEAKGKLSSEELDLYAILFLLDGPVVGDKMNTAWKTVETLGENYPKRQKLLSLIRKLSIIPDKIFKDPNSPRHKAIITLFAKNFPEYLNYYGSTCIKYISNSGTELLNVSSSFQCNEFLRAAQALKKENKGQSTPWLSDSVESQYSGLKK